MKSALAGLAVVLVLGGNAHSQESSTPATAPSTLGQPFQMKLGNVYALTLHQTAEVFMETAKWKSPLIISFDSKAGTLAVEIIGSGRSSIDAAKKSVEEFRTEVLSPALAKTNEMLAATVTEDMLSITYLNGSTLKPMITFQGGTFTIN